MDDKTAPMPATAAAAAASPSEPPRDHEATENREPQGEPAPREGSALYAAPEFGSGDSFDVEVERKRAPPARPAVGYTATFAAPAAPSMEGRERPRPISTGPAPAEVFASRASFVGDDDGQKTLSPSVLAPPAGVGDGRPRERMPIGLPLPSESSQPVPASAARAGPDDPTYAGAIVPASPPPAVTGDQHELVITAPMALGTLTALRAKAVPTQPHVQFEPPADVDDEPPPIHDEQTHAAFDDPGHVEVTDEVPTPVANSVAHVEVTAEVPTPIADPTQPVEVTAEVPAQEKAPEPTGTPTLELPAAPAVAPDDPTLLRGAPSTPKRRNLAVPLALTVLAVLGVVGGLTLRSLLSRPGDVSLALAEPASDASATVTASPAAPELVPRPPVVPPPLLPPPPVAAPTVAPPPVAATPMAPPPVEPAMAPAAAAPERPTRAADGFGPFVDASGAASGLGRALGGGVRAVLGDALAGSTVGVRGEVRRARFKNGVATAECGLTVFDARGLRATVRGAATVEVAGAAAVVALPKAAEACARAVEGELRAAVDHAKAAR